MRRTWIRYLLLTLLASATLAVFHAARPRAARAEDTWHQWALGPMGETCSGSCDGRWCCQIVVKPAPDP